MFDCRKALLVVTAACSMAAAEAAYIVETGEATGSLEISLNDQGVSFQHLGVSFSVQQDSEITSVEGWITGLVEGNVAFELRDGATPDGALLFSSIVTVPVSAAAWRGATGLNWAVSAGDYTLVAIAQDGFSGGMTVGPSNPAGTEWFNNALSNGWSVVPFNFGWRIAAEASTVPESGSLALAALAIATLGAVHRRRGVSDGRAGRP